MSIVDPPKASPPSEERRRALRWIIPVILIGPVLQLWKQSHEKEEAAAAIAQIGSDEDPTALLRKSPEQLLCDGDTPSLCDRLTTWKEAKDCSAKRTALAELKAALGEYSSSPRLMKIVGGVVNVETATISCKDDQL